MKANEIDQELLDLPQFKQLKFRIFQKFLMKIIFSRDIGMPA